MYMWHRVKLEEGRPVLSGRQAKVPGAGVWVATIDREANGQTTREAIAKDGEIVWKGTCYCGHDRHLAFQRAGELLKIIKRSGI